MTNCNARAAGCGSRSCCRCAPAARAAAVAIERAVNVPAAAPPAPSGKTPPSGSPYEGRFVYLADLVDGERVLTIRQWRAEHAGPVSI